jgi:hypothetical protein
MKKFFLSISIFLLFFSCTKDVLESTIFIPDENDGNLPAYTEWGYNSFGAVFERDYFLAASNIVPCKIIYNDNQIQFLLSGNYNYGSQMSLLFVFPVTYILNNYSDLVKLHKLEIDLSDPDCMVKLTLNDNEKILDVVDGKLLFNRAQLLKIDDRDNRVILSGYFEVRFREKEFPSTISNGRFDLGITKNTFYVY